MFNLRENSISALVDRWCLDTHAFHLLCGEYTITLEDVLMQLMLPADGDVVTGLSKVVKPLALCYQLLGDSSGYGKLDSPI
ncbi:hypothetical protein PVK06_041090 [Gossypium arboreum]|uniref:Aminotransferase-like plant mobile domain-containing protein n=1 Tax=Gossypium arboreum TaxID=29729 RepID=A0ABR0N790_GOSAR|nr:hypothetical protein PVK06_041090 [Gossypium arboreum]